MSELPAVKDVSSAIHSSGRVPIFQPYTLHQELDDSSSGVASEPFHACGESLKKEEILLPDSESGIDAEAGEYIRGLNELLVQTPVLKVDEPNSAGHWRHLAQPVFYQNPPAMTNSSVSQLFEQLQSPMGSDGYQTAEYYAAPPSSRNLLEPDPEIYVEQFIQELLSQDPPTPKSELASGLSSHSPRSKSRYCPDSPRRAHHCNSSTGEFSDGGHWDKVFRPVSSPNNESTIPQGFTSPKSPSARLTEPIRTVHLPRPQGMVGMALYAPAYAASSLAFPCDLKGEKSCQIGEVASRPCPLLPPGSSNSPEDYQEAICRQHRELLTLFVKAAITSHRNASIESETPEAMQSYDAPICERLDGSGGIRESVDSRQEPVDLPELLYSGLSAPNCDFNKARREVIVSWTQDEVPRMQKFSCKKLGKEEAFRRAQELMLSLTYHAVRDAFPSVENSEFSSRRNWYPSRLRNVLPDEIIYQYDGPFDPILIYRKYNREWEVQWTSGGVLQTARWSCKKLGKPEAVARAEKFVNLLVAGDPAPQVRRSSRTASSIQPEPFDVGNSVRDCCPVEVPKKDRRSSSERGYREERNSRNLLNRTLDELLVEEATNNQATSGVDRVWESWIARPSISERWLSASQLVSPKSDIDASSPSGARQTGVKRTIEESASLSSTTKRQQVLKYSSPTTTGLPQNSNNFTSSDDDRILSNERDPSSNFNEEHRTLLNFVSTAAIVWPSQLSFDNINQSVRSPQWQSKKWEAQKLNKLLTARLVKKRPFLQTTNFNPFFQSSSAFVYPHYPFHPKNENNKNNDPPRFEPKWTKFLGKLLCVWKLVRSSERHRNLLRIRNLPSPPTPDDLSSSLTPDHLPSPPTPDDLSSSLTPDSDPYSLLSYRLRTTTDSVDEDPGA